MEKHARNVNSLTNEERDRQDRRFGLAHALERVMKKALQQFLLSQCDTVDGLRL